MTGDVAMLAFILFNIVVVLAVAIWNVYEYARKHKRS